MRARGALALERVVGDVVRLADVEAAERCLADLWLSTLHETPAGHCGWYRRLDRTDRVGVVATAQGIIACAEIGAAIPRLDETVAALLRLQLPGGGWAFVSTVSEIAVVDATVWAILALQLHRDDVELARFCLPDVVDRATATLQGWALEDGGWGLTASGPLRVYSTALALRAMARTGQGNTRAAQMGLQRLVAQVDPTVGAWRDTQGRISVPVTAEAIRAITDVVGSTGRHSATVTRARTWLVSTGRQSDYWKSDAAVTSNEEVEYRVPGTDHIRRIEHRFSPRPLAISALSTSADHLSPAAVQAVHRLTAGLTCGDWSEVAGIQEREASSWMIYDACLAISDFRRSVPAGVDEVWANGSKVVPSRAGAKAIVKFLRRRRPWLTSAGVGGATVVMLNLGGAVSGYGISMVAWILSALVIAVVGNALSTYLLTDRAK